MTAVVTGAGQGIGRSIALKLAASADKTWRFSAVISRSARIGRRAKSKKSDAPRSPFTATSRARATSKPSARPGASPKLGAPHVVVNNAGVTHRADVAIMDEKDWDEVVEREFERRISCHARIFTRSMIPRKNGRFIAISSISATLGTASA